LLIIDSIGGACGGEPESAEVVLRFFTALRSLKITPLCVDHIAKVGVSGTPFGSIYKYNASRNLWEMRKNQEPGEDFIEIGLIHRKINVGKLLPPIGYRFDFFDTSIKVKEIKPSQIPEIAKDMPLKFQIKELLAAEGALTVGQIAEELETTQASVRVVLNRGKGKDFIKVDGLSWGILGQAEEA